MALLFPTSLPDLKADQPEKDHHVDEAGILRAKMTTLQIILRSRDTERINEDIADHLQRRDIERDNEEGKLKRIMTTVQII